MNAPMNRLATLLRSRGGDGGSFLDGMTHMASAKPKAVGATKPRPELDKAVAETEGVRDWSHFARELPESMPLAVRIFVGNLLGMLDEEGIAATTDGLADAMMTAGLRLGATTAKRHLTGKGLKTSEIDHDARDAYAERFGYSHDPESIRRDDHLPRWRAARAESNGEFGESRRKTKVASLAMKAKDTNKAEAHRLLDAAWDTPHRSLAVLVLDYLTTD